ncbi:MAG: NADH-quinone oxidoreductase subunit C [Chloroflexi bacterium]|nr:NADH-quinone oxidoreductase subunit C [Chloroflexota bacterium]
MTKALSGPEVARKVNERFPNAVIEAGGSALSVKNESLRDIAEFLKTDPELAFDFLSNISAVDYFHADYFEVTYHLTSMAKNHSLVLKTRCFGRDNPTVPSVTSVWKGANFQEREVYDLMGIGFSGHPDLRRIFLWQGFAGHPLRRDFLGAAQVPGEEE